MRELQAIEFVDSPKGSSRIRAMDFYQISLERFSLLLLRYWERAAIFYPVLIEGRPHMVRFHPDNQPSPAFEQIRTVEPVKAFFTNPRERVAGFPGLFQKGFRDQILIGLKGCDLRALLVLDQIYLGGEFLDPFYEERRRRTLIIGADCTEPGPNCFCNLVGGNPYPEGGSDLNLSLLPDGYGIEVVTDKGRAFIEENRDLFLPGQARDDGRGGAQELLRRQNPKPLPQNLPQRVMARIGPGYWLEVGRQCLECYACEQICPTCYCFLLYDEGFDNQFYRTRVWDYCYLPAYARVGGGLNPRPNFPQRFRNRFECKFSAFAENHGVYACSGCGRCVAACPGHIDIREVLYSI